MASNSPLPPPNCPAQCPQAGNDAPSKRQRRSVSRALDKLLVQGVLLLVTGVALLEMSGWRSGSLNIFEQEWKQAKPAPLVMEGGDPYIRALMRTISASESNVPKPYSVIYGGEHFRGWDRHPDRCVTISVGPNTGNCSTAAGRYQFITTTWEAQADKYHPEPPGLLFWRPHRFDPKSQDQVVHDWLSNADEWGEDLSGLLREGQIGTVLEILSPTWTSLGYGIETNSMSSYLPEIYSEMLDEELAAAAPLLETSPAPPEATTPLESTEPLVTQADADAIAATENSPDPKPLQKNQPFLLPPGEVLRRLGQELETLL